MHFYSEQVFIWRRKKLWTVFKAHAISARCIKNRCDYDGWLHVQNILRVASGHSNKRSIYLNKPVPQLLKHTPFISALLEKQARKWWLIAHLLCDSVTPIICNINYAYQNEVQNYLSLTKHWKQSCQVPK